MFTQEYRLSSLRLSAGTSVTRALRLIRPFICALLVFAIPISSVSAAVIRTNLTPPEARQWVHQTVQTIEEALYLPAGQVLPGALQLALDSGTLNATQYAQFHQLFVEGKAPPNQPEIAYVLSLPQEEQITYSLQRLQQLGKLSAQEVQLFTNLRSAPLEEVHAMAVTALESGSYGTYATIVLQLAVDLTDIDTSSKLEICDATSSTLHAQGWLGDVLKWVGGLVLAVIGGALVGGLLGLLGGYSFGFGAMWGGIRGGALYILATIPSGFKPGPNGEDCTGWPPPR